MVDLHNVWFYCSSYWFSACKLFSVSLSRVLPKPWKDVWPLSESTRSRSYESYRKIPCWSCQSLWIYLLLNITCIYIYIYCMFMYLNIIVHAYMGKVHFIALHYITLCCITSHCFTFHWLHRIAFHFSTVDYIALHYIALLTLHHIKFTALHFFAFYRIALSCTALRFSKLQTRRW